MWESQRYVPREGGASGGGLLDDARYLMIGEAGDDRCQQRDNRNTVAAERAHGGEAACWLTGAWLQLPAELRIDGRQRDADRCEPL